MSRAEGTQESLLVPSSEQPFLDSIAEGSELLASSLDHDAQEPAPMFDHQPGRLLGKLLDVQRYDDDAQALSDLKR